MIVTMPETDVTRNVLINVIACCYIWGGHTISANRMAPKIYTHDYDDCDMKMSNFTFQGVRNQATTKFPSSP